MLKVKEYKIMLGSKTTRYLQVVSLSAQARCPCSQAVSYSERVWFQSGACWTRGAWGTEMYAGMSPVECCATWRHQFLSPVNKMNVICLDRCMVCFGELSSEPCFLRIFTSSTFCASNIHNKSSTSCIVVVSSRATPIAPSSKYLRLIFLCSARDLMAAESCSDRGTTWRVSK